MLHCSLTHSESFSKKPHPFFPMGHHILWIPRPQTLSLESITLPWIPVRVSSVLLPPVVESPRGPPLTVSPAPFPQHPWLSLANGPWSLDSVPGREVEVLVPSPACLAVLLLQPQAFPLHHTPHTGRVLGPGISTVHTHVCCQSKLGSK